MPDSPIRRAAILAVLLTAAPAGAQDAFYDVPFRELSISEGDWPEPAGWSSRRNQIGALMRPYAAMDGAGEVYIVPDDAERGGAWLESDPRDWRLLARIPAAASGSGSLFVPTPEFDGMARLRFVLSPEESAADDREAYLSAKAAHYSALRARGLPGSAFFRWQADQAWKATGETPPPGAVGSRDFSDSYNLFSGGRALAENLQLERDIAAASDPNTAARDHGQELVPTSRIEGITVQPMDFKALLAGAEPVLDALAPAIPADQHAIFFPSFEALAAVAAEARENGLPLARLGGARGEDGQLMARYERQLGLSTEGLAHLLGPHVIRSIAITGSDPYFPTGTDIAIVFEAANPESLRALLVMQARLAAAGKAEVADGDIDGIPCTSITTRDRAMSAHFALVGQAVVATNSPAQLRRLGAVRNGESPSLASLDEYRFFRARYPLGNADETAFIMISDATIRRWCSAPWRIATSRRLRALAVLSDLTAAHMGELVPGVAAERPVLGEVPMRTIGETFIGPRGARSSVYNTIHFITPAAELDLSEATRDEATAYERWRDTYQRNWRWAFDPIAISLSVSPSRLATDLSVMPLILGSRYGNWLSFTQGAAIAPGAGDPHDALAHAVFAVNAESPAVKQASGMAAMFSPEIGLDALGWLGKSVAIYADPDPFWAEMADASDADTFLGDNIHRLPVALRAEVSSIIKLTAFLAAARAYIDQAAPGMTTWETRRHGEQPYVRVGASEQARAEAGEDAIDQIAVYYAAMPRSITLSLSEDVLRRAIDRERARAAGEAAESPWLGTSACLTFTGAGLDLIEGPGGETVRLRMQTASWNNIAALNEWRRLFPDRDPLAIHEAIWGARPVCPGGGMYAWNDELRTMESSVFGCPARQLAGPDGLTTLDIVRRGNLGVTFENDGLRARAVIDREP